MTTQFKGMARCVRPIRALVALTAALLAGGEARADSITLTTVDRGYYGRSGFHNAADNNYATGVQDSFRSFFVFNLSGVEGEVIGARLELHNPRDGASGVGVFTLFDVDTAVETLVQSQAAAAGIFDDLGAGVAYGSAPDATGAVVMIELNPAFLNAINARTSEMFAMGGKLGDEQSSAYAFAGTGSCFGGPQLILEVRPPSEGEPTPAPLPGVAAGAGGLLLLRSVRRGR